MRWSSAARLGVATLLACAPAAEAVATDVVIPPDWRKLPDGFSYIQVYPAAAREANVIGKVRLGCNVSAQGKLEQCQLLMQSPPGWGFGAAALAMTKSFSWRPETVNGVPVGGIPVVIPFDFGASSGEDRAVTIMAFVPDGSTPRLVDPTWSQAPTRAQLASVFPSEDVGKVDSGYAVLRCKIKPDGSLTRCDALTASPAASEFKLSALKLADSFKLSVADYEPRTLRGAFVDIPISFIAPGAASPRLTAPQWVSTLDEADLAAVFPAKARAAGVSRGGGVVKCRVTHEGRLVDCQLLSESPEGLGFGDAALKAADFLAMNPWSMDGAPVDDAIIQTPITLALPEHQAGAEGDIVTNPDWIRRPNADDVTSAYPVAAARARESGEARISCHITSEGLLVDCTVLTESPVGAAFGQAALALSPKFAMRPATRSGQSVAGRTVILPFRFQPPDSGRAAP